MANENMLSQILNNTVNTSSDEEKAKDRIDALKYQKDMGYISNDDYIKQIQGFVSQLPKTNPLSDINFKTAPIQGPIPDFVTNTEASNTEIPQKDQPTASLTNSSSVEASVAPIVPNITSPVPTTLPPAMAAAPVSESLTSHSAIPDLAKGSAFNKALEQQKQDEIKALAEAKQEDISNQAQGLFLKGAGQVAGGTASAASKAVISPDMSTAEGMLKNPNRFQEEARQKIADTLAAEERVSKRGQVELERQKMDPTSSTSENYRSVIKDIAKTTGINFNMPDNASAAELEKQFPMFKEMMEARAKQQEFGLKRQERADAKQAKEDENTTKRLVAGYNKLDKYVVDKQGQLLTPVNEVQTLLDSTKGNSLAWSAVTAKLPRILGEKGVLTDNDITRYSTSPAWAEKFKQQRNLAIDGKPSDLMVADVRQIMDIMKKKAEEEIGKNAASHISAMKQQNKNVSEEDLRSQVDPRGLALEYEANQFAQKNLKDYQKTHPEATAADLATAYKLQKGSSVL